jgi:hypothetical protein
MPTNITEVDTFTATVPVPNDAEAATAASLLAMAQPLANRTTNLKGRVDNAIEYANYAISGAVASGGTLTLSLTSKNGDFVLASNEVEVPAAGTYIVAMCMQATSVDVTNPLAMGLTLQKGGSTIEQSINRRYSADAGDSVNVAMTSTIVVTTPASEKLNVEAVIGAGNLSVSGSSRLVIHRLF